MKRTSKRILSILVAVCAMGLAAGVQAQDVVTVGTVSTSATTVDVPVYIRDVSGSPLGIDQPAGSRIQSYSIKVNYSPASAVQSVTFARAGITSSLTPTQELTPSSTGAISLIDTFDESTNLIPFGSNAAVPGNQVGVLHFTLDPSATPGTNITLALDTTLTQLTDQGGDAATKESTGGGNLALVNGSIAVTAAIVLGQGAPTLSTTMLLVLAGALALAAIRMRL